MAGTQAGKSKKGRKIGHWKKKPTHQRYVARRSWIQNKARRIARSVRHGMKMPPNMSAELSTAVRSLL